MEFVMALFIGIGLSATVGFRVFTPLLITSIAEKASMVTLAEGFSWIGSTPALIAFLVATILEIASAYIPFVDQLLKTLATPIAIIAGVLLTASFIGNMDPLLTWSIAIIAGGSTATVSQLTTTTVKGVSTVSTAGLGNGLISFGEGIIAVVMSIISLFLPIVAALIVLTIFISFFIIVRTLRRKRKRTNVAHV